MPSLKEVLSDNLKRILSDKNISQSELARKLDVSFQTVNAIMNARGGTTWATVSKLARVLEVEETELVAVQKPAEKVEVPKVVWEWMAASGGTGLNPPTIVAQHSFREMGSIPSDILKDLSELDPESQETAWIGFRAVIAGLKGSGKGKKEEAG